MSFIFNHLKAKYDFWMIGREIKFSVTKEAKIEGRILREKIEEIVDAKSPQYPILEITRFLDDRSYKIIYRKSHWGIETSMSNMELYYFMDSWKSFSSGADIKTKNIQTKEQQIQEQMFDTIENFLSSLEPKIED